MKRILLQSAVPVAILLLAGCSAPSTTNDQVAAENAVGNALPDEMVADQNAEASVTVVPPPAAPAGLSSEDAAPLGQAAQVATEIESEADVERVPFEGGWAWRRHGQILRTSSRDGRRISYFHPGESAPFFVQQGEESFAYSGGRARRAYDRGGRAVPIAPRQQDEARRLADQSRHDHGQAQQAASLPRGRDAGHDRSDRDSRAPHDRAAPPAQTPPTANSAGVSPDRERNARPDRRRERPSDEDQANRMGRRTP